MSKNYGFKKLVPESSVITYLNIRASNSVGEEQKHETGGVMGELANGDLRFPGNVDDGVHPAVLTSPRSD